MADKQPVSVTDFAAQFVEVMKMANISRKDAIAVFEAATRISRESTDWANPMPGGMFVPMTPGVVPGDDAPALLAAEAEAMHDAGQFVNPNFPALPIPFKR